MLSRTGFTEANREPDKTTARQRMGWEGEVLGRNPRVCRPRREEKIQAKDNRMMSRDLVLYGNLSFILLTGGMRTADIMIVTEVRYPTTFSLTPNGLRVTSIRDISHMKGMDVRPLTSSRQTRFLFLRATLIPLTELKNG